MRATLITPSGQGNDRRGLSTSPTSSTGKTCSCCSRSPSQRAFDRHQVESGIKQTTSACPQCKTPVIAPLKLPGFLDRADVVRRLAPDNFKTPLHLVGYRGSRSTFRKQRRKCSIRRIV